MIKPAMPETENQRIKTLQSLNVLDTAPEERIDRITKIASNMFGVPIVLVSLVDSERQWFKSCVGLAVNQTGRDASFCAHVILQSEVFVVEDTFDDNRFADNPLVLGEPNIRFYAGCPLIHADGSRLGTLCLIDNVTRQFSDDDRQILRELATLVELELVQQHTHTMDQESGLSNMAGFEKLSAISLAVCTKLDLKVSIGFIYIKGLLSLKKNPNLYATIVKQLGAQFKAHFRSSDLVARYDDCSFVALITNANQQTTQTILNTLEMDINKMLAAIAGQQLCQVITGIVEGQSDENVDDLLFNAFLKLHE